MASKKKAEKPFFAPFQAVAGKVKPVAATKPSSPVPTKAQAGDDAGSFADFMYGVAPVKQQKRAVKPEPAPSEELARAELRALVDGGSERFEVADDGRVLSGRRVDVDAKLVRRLRRGELPIDVRLDLHGKTAGEARKALATFLGSARADGERVALIIHGKGKHSPGQPVLRGEIAAWLSQGEASPHVAAFATALPDDGGEGAVYVLLRR